MSEKLYRTLEGDWKVSEWKDGVFYYTQEDGHTYFVTDDKKVGHVECYECLKTQHE